jgi:hypothetical protein
LPLKWNYASFREDAKTGPTSPAVGAMRIQPCLNVWLDVMLRRDLNEDTDGIHTRYRREAPTVRMEVPMYTPRSRTVFCMDEGILARF